MRETRWRVVEPNGRSYPPGSQPLRSYEAALRRVAYYSTLTRATGEGRLPRLPLSIEWQQVECGPWNGHLRGLDLVSPLDPAPSPPPPCEVTPMPDLSYPIKLDDNYTCQGTDARGVALAFSDLLTEGDKVGPNHPDDDCEGEPLYVSGVVVRRDDGLWVETLVPSRSLPSGSTGTGDAL